MSNPKVSVLIPTYNRKYCISNCVDSALNQTFQDYEIIVRDNCSTDGTCDFLLENYSSQIKEGKLKVYRNKENIGLSGNTLALINDARGDYFILLHSDDMILPHTVQHLSDIVKESNADVVHLSSCLASPLGKISKNIAEYKLIALDSNFPDKIVVVPEDPMIRYSQWFEFGIFHDAQYNLFKKEFVLSNKIFVSNHDYYYLALLWIMLSKVIVKTPIPCYVRTRLPDSGTSAPFSIEILKDTIDDAIRSIRDFDEFFSKIDFFKKNEHLQYITKTRYMTIVDNFFINGKRGFKDGIVPEIYDAVKDSFQKYFGDNYFYPMFLFNWVHTLPFGQRVDAINPPPPPIQYRGVILNAA